MNIHYESEKCERCGESAVVRSPPCQMGQDATLKCENCGNKVFVWATNEEMSALNCSEGAL